MTTYLCSLVAHFSLSSRGVIMTENSCAWNLWKLIVVCSRVWVLFTCTMIQLFMHAPVIYETAVV